MPVLNNTLTAKKFFDFIQNVFVDFFTIVDIFFSHFLYFLFNSNKNVCGTFWLNINIDIKETRLFKYLSIRIKNQKNVPNRKKDYERIKFKFKLLTIPLIINLRIL